MSVDSGLERAMSHLAHELRTPLSVIQGYAELVGARDDEKTRKAASTNILSAAGLLSDLVDDVLIAFALDAGALSVEPSPIELQSEVAAAVARVAPNAGKLETSDRIWVSADAQHLARILKTLLLTARRHAPEAEVRIGLHRDADYALVTISDDGPALTEEQIAVLFDRFSDTAGRSTGLELHNVQQLVELHGGSISAAGEPANGTTFTFSVPLAEEPPET